MSIRIRKFGSPFVRLCLLGIFAIAAISGAPSASAAVVGTITVGPPSEKKDADIGGVDLIASRQVDLADNCLAGAAVHWIQLVTVSTALGAGGLGFAGFSAGTTFIDPIPGQPIGIRATGNTTPFFDITANRFADLGNSAKWLTDGTGSLFTDAPQLPWESLTDKNTPFTFTAQTLLVATTAAAPNTLNVLGGFRWGFTLDIAPNRVTLQDPAGLAWAEIDAKLWQAALDKDFGPEGTYKIQEATCPKGNPTVGFKLVPEPSSLAMAALGIPMAIAIARRRRRGSWRAARIDQAFIELSDDRPSGRDAHRARRSHPPG